MTMPEGLPAIAISDRAGFGQPNAIRLLFVEDDEYFRETLACELSEHGFAVRGFADATSLMNALDDAVDADIILLDWGLPKTSGIDLLTQLRRRGINLPVVFLTGRRLVANESLALERGAADFIIKGRGIDVLVRRLKLVDGSRGNLKAPKAHKQYVCGKLTLRPDISRAYWTGIDLNFTFGEYNIVHLLASNVGRYVTYRAIYDRMHYVGFIAGSGDDGYRANVRSAIKRIRNKFRDLAPDFAEIQNYSAFGYCWGRVSDLAEMSDLAET
jgi:two-component system response regulator ChvI